VKLRSYQVKLNKPTKKFLKDKKAGQRAQVYAPTGAGKTVCFNELIKEAIKNGKTNIAILHPRIALSQDQLRRFQKEFKSSVHTTSFHSGGYVINEGAVGGTSTTSEDELLAILEQVDIPHVTFSSYHSFDKLLNIKFDIVICDEAHYLTQDRFLEYLPNINADKILFYTATPITSEMEDDYMKDFSLFGPVIAQVEPKELIIPGFILAPLVHIMECRTGTAGNYVDVVDVVARAYADQYRDVKANNMPFVQMLVASRGLNDLRELETNLARLWSTIDSQLGKGTLSEPVTVYTIDSTGSFRNGKPVADRDSALREIKEGGKNVIVAHYDTLSEGIDIDTLTGAVIMRVMSKAKLIQTIGRCARPYVGDLDPATFTPKKSLYNFDKGIDKRQKPRCIITFPVIDGKWIANDNGKGISEAFIAGGYDSLLTYIKKNEDTALGTPRTPLLEIEDNTLISSIQDHHSHRTLTDLHELFDLK
jgi:superfamily II DNA or RNA helicase